MYDRGKDLNWKTFKDIGFIAAMGKVHCVPINVLYIMFSLPQAGGGRNEVDPRFISLFSTFNVTFPSHESLFHIYSAILAGYLIPFNTKVQSLAKTLTTATLELYQRVVRDLPPTPSKFHYIFNLRDLSRIYHGLSLIKPDRFDDPPSLVRVWRNECHRVFYDRLTNNKDRNIVKVITTNNCTIIHYFIY